MVALKKLVNHANDYLGIYRVNDYCPNGLQVEGRAEVKHLVTGVTANLALLEAAVDCQADAILVHHGYFWKGEAATISGMKKQRLACLLANDISLLAYHLPLDMHAEVGNNIQLAHRLDLVYERSLEPFNKGCVAVKGHLKTPLSVEDFSQKINCSLARLPLVEAEPEQMIETIAWCTGAAQHYIEQAATQGIDAFLTGEVSEQTIHTAREMGIAFFAAGHHATERYGVQALGEYLQNKYSIKHTFIDIDNPV